ncbi:hypothetical protein M0804_013703 [Polistes exclamans]|nr:hypothetical protein M0804_013703 [Polistes exclamans]
MGGGLIGGRGGGRTLGEVGTEGGPSGVHSGCTARRVPREVFGGRGAWPSGCSLGRRARGIQIADPSGIRRHMTLDLEELIHLNPVYALVAYSKQQKLQVQLVFSYTGQFVVSYNVEGKTHMIMIWKFLNQLCVKKYGIVAMAEFHNKFKALI